MAILELLIEAKNMAFLFTKLRESVFFTHHVRLMQANMISMGYNTTYLNPCTTGSKSYYRINSVQEMKVRAS